jgi:hypothetical protein
MGMGVWERGEETDRKGAGQLSRSPRADRTICQQQACGAWDMGLEVRACGDGAWGMGWETLHNGGGGMVMEMGDDGTLGMGIMEHGKWNMMGHGAYGG